MQTKEEKQKALEEMWDMSRNIVDLTAADRWYSAFGIPYEKVKAKPRKCKEFYRCVYKNPEWLAMATWEVAEDICKQITAYKKEPDCRYVGTGKRVECIAREYLKQIAKKENLKVPEE
jgi:hypothetical protein